MDKSKSKVRPGYQPRFNQATHGEATFSLSDKVDSYIKDRPSQGHHKRFVDDEDDEDTQAGASRSENATGNKGGRRRSRSRSRSKERRMERDEVETATAVGRPFLTTTNTLPPNRKKDDHGVGNKAKASTKDSTRQDRRDHVDAKDRDTVKVKDRDVDKTHDRDNSRTPNRPLLTTVNQPSPKRPIQNQNQHQRGHPYRAQEHQASQPSPGREKAFTSPLPSPQKIFTRSPNSASSPLGARRRMGTIIKPPKLAVDNSSPPPPRSPSVTSITSSPGSHFKVSNSPKSHRKLKSPTRYESLDSLPEIPETEEEYDALSYQAKMRLGDEIQVRNKIRERQTGTFTRRHGGEHDRDQDQDDNASEASNKENRRQDIEKNRETKDQKKMQNKTKELAMDKIDMQRKDNDEVETADKANHEHNRKNDNSRKQKDVDRPLYQAQHTDLQKDSYGPDNSDSDLDDLDPFNTIPLGRPTKNTPSTTSKVFQLEHTVGPPTTAFPNGAIHPKESPIVVSDSSDSETSRSDHKSTPASNSRDKRKDDHHTRVRTVSKKASPKSKPRAVTDEERQKYSQLIIQRPILTHPSSSSSKSTAVTPEIPPVESKDSVTPRKKATISKSTGEAKRNVEQGTKFDYFDLSAPRKATNESSSPSPPSSSSAREKLGSELQHPRTPKSPFDLDSRRKEPSSVRSRSSAAMTKRSIETCRARLAKSDSESPVEDSQSNKDLGNNVYDLVTPPRPTRPLKDRNRYSIESPSKKRNKPASSDLSSDEDAELPDLTSTPTRTNTRTTPVLLSASSDPFLASPGTWTPRSGAIFKLPSPSKKRTRLSMPSDADLLLDDDDDVPGIVLEQREGSENTCPYCGDTLPSPENMTRRLRTALEKVRAKLMSPRQRSSTSGTGSHHRISDGSAGRPLSPLGSDEDMSLLHAGGGSGSGNDAKSRHDGVDRYGHGNDDSERDERSTRERVYETSMMDRFEFCRIHVAEEKIVPLGIERNYPLSIRFGELPDRVERMQDELKAIIEKRGPSFYLDNALDKYKRMGTHGARNVHVVLANIEHSMPGYYGSKGSAVLSEILAKLFLETNILTHELASPQTPIEYVQQVLVPEAGLRLIVEDRLKLARDAVDPISLEAAREIMVDSVEFGKYIHDINF